MEFELENPLTSLKEHQPDTVPALFADECHHIPSHYFSHSSKSRDFYVSLRREAISFILKFSCDFNPFIPYLAISYIDRFIPKHEILIQRNRWIVKLLTMSCLSIAAKMKNTELLLSDLKRDEGFISDAKSIRRMELLVLTTLNWRMRPVTPFSFLHFFLSLFELRHDQLSIESLKDRASEFIFKSHYEVKVLEYKPSIISASALLCASQVLFPMEFPCFRSAIASCEYVNKEKLLNCLTIMEEIVAMDINESKLDAVLSSGTKTPVSVLDRLLCSTTPTQSETTTTSSKMITERDSIKRRKINGQDLLYSTLLRPRETEFSGTQ